MGASAQSSLTTVTTIRSATWDDLEPVVELLDARSRAAFGTSEVQLAHVRAEWELPSFVVGRDNWVAVDDGRVVGYAHLDARRNFQHAALDPEVGDALLTRVEERGRARGFDRISVVAVPED